MTLNFGNNLFPPRGELGINVNFQDLISGQGFVDFLASGENTERGIVPI